MTESASTTHVDPAWPQEPEPRRGRVNRPRRALIALLELILAAAAAWGATLCWSEVITRVTMHTSEGTAVTSRIFSGPWVAATIGLGLLAALLLLDLFRELALAWRTRR